MKKTVLIWLILFLAHTAFAQIPLRDVRFITSPMKLDGVWGFVQDKALLPQETQTMTKTLFLPYYLEENPKNNSSTGIATFVIDLKTTPGKPLSIDFNPLVNAWKLFMDGNLVCTSGSIDTQHRIYQASPKVKIAHFIPTGEKTRLTLWVANSQHRHFGIGVSPRIAPEGILEASHSSRTTVDLVTISILAVTALYHLGLYIVWRRDKAPLWFGLFLVTFIVRIATTSEKLITTMFNGISWEMVTRAEYISGYLTLPLFILYIGSLYPKQSIKNVEKVNLILGIAFLLIAISVSTLFLTSMMPFVELVIIQSVLFVAWVLMRAYRDKEAHSGFALLTFGLFGLSIFHDVLMFSKIIDDTQDYGPIGFLFFLFAQASILLQRYANAFRTLQKNETDLEHIITKRTAQLNNLLSQRELLMRELNHRVKNNLQFILGLLWTKRSRASDETQEILLSLQSQIQAIATVHETLCDPSDISLLDGVNYLKTIIDALKNLYPDVTFTYTFGKEGMLSMDDTVSLGLVVSELVSNSIKHAFSNQSGTVHIEFEVQNNIAKLTYSDDQTVFQNIDFLTASPTRKRLGWSMIMALIRQLHGKTIMENDCLTIHFTADKAL